MADQRQTSQSQQSDTDTSKTHPMANEILDDDPAASTSAPPRLSEDLVPASEQRVGGFVLKVVGLVILIGLVITYFLIDNPLVMVAAGVVFILLMVLFLAPVLLARSTRLAEDEAVRSRDR